MLSPLLVPVIAHYIILIYPSSIIIDSVSVFRLSVSVYIIDNVYNSLNSTNICIV